MAFAFNDDKSVYDLEEIEDAIYSTFSRFRTLTGGPVSVPAQSRRMVLITQQELEEWGIDPSTISGYAVVSAMLSTDGGETWRTDWDNYGTAYVPAIVVRTNAPTVQSPIAIQLSNHTTGSYDINWRIVLMRLALSDSDTD